MPPKRTKAAASFHNKEVLGREIRRNRLALFIQQFEKEGRQARLEKNIKYGIRRKGKF